MSSQIDRDADILWQYLSMTTPLGTADCIIVMGSVDVRSATHAAGLMKKGLAPKVIFSGNCGRNTEGVFQQTEAELFAEEAIRWGVDPESILLEKQATNTGENIKFSLALLAKKQIPAQRFILVHKPFATRRALATFLKYKTDAEVMLSAADLSFKSYINDVVDRELLLHTLVGDMQRMKVYPEKGYQVAMPIPDDVWLAWQRLVDKGYTRDLVVDERACTD